MQKKKKIKRKRENKKSNSIRLPKILLVEDETRLRKVLKKVLIAEGYDVIACASAEKAIVEFKNQKCDLIISDLVMPGMNGIQLLKKAKRIKPDVKMIVITAYGSYETAQQALKLGVYDYIEKPFNLNDLRMNIKKVLKLKKKVEPKFLVREKGKRDIQRKEIKTWVEKIQEIAGDSILAIGESALMIKKKTEPVIKKSISIIDKTARRIDEKTTLLLQKYYKRKKGGEV